MYFRCKHIAAFLERIGQSLRRSIRYYLTLSIILNIFILELDFYIFYEKKHGMNYYKYVDSRGILPHFAFRKDDPFVKNMHRSYSVQI